MRTLSEAQERQMERLLARSEVKAYRSDNARASCWSAAPVEVLTAFPLSGYRLVAGLRVAGTAQCATAIAYERPPTDCAVPPRSSGRELAVLIARARALGADAIVIHGALSGEAASPGGVAP
jgi:hypothetical protein